MPRKCTTCAAEIPAAYRNCPACDGATPTLLTVIVRRAGVCAVVCLIVLAGFYLSLITSADKLSYHDKQSVQRSIQVLRDAGFSEEVFMLSRLAAFRSNDNWLNASVVKENAYAATNFPFGIVTLYPDFFALPLDDTERAAILLHEAKHMQGDDEPAAYAYVWKNRHRLGWTRDRYTGSLVWQNVRGQTREYHPELFQCPERQFSDCTEQEN
jgi:hypothetical protein